ncbi:MAG: aminotransferase class V-fold PLP-dependent enzyme [Pirellulales bacterium]
MELHRIYLDSAATSWPKPLSVYEAVEDYQRRLGVPVGRGGYATALHVAECLEASRRAIANLIDAECADRIVFTFNCTDALNLAIHGVVRSGDHVVTSTAEHNSGACKEFCVT